MAGRYDRLARYLRALPAELDEVTLSFRDLERILGASLPRSAIDHPAWWANQRDTSTRPQARAWLSAGWRVAEVRRAVPGGQVRLRRSRATLGLPERESTTFGGSTAPPRTPRPAPSSSSAVRRGSSSPPSMASSPPRR